ncbi:hypothetical protein ACI78T_16715 [Blastococcus sp. SYSU D00922]
MTTSESRSANAEVVLPDGTHARVTLGESRYGVRGEWRGQLSVETWTECTQPFGCAWDRLWGSTELTDAEVQFTRNLGSASAVDVPVTLRGGGLGPGAGTERQVTVSVVLTGTGAVTRSVDHSDVCGDTGEPGCLSARTSALRDATANVTVDGVAVVGAGTIDHLSGIDVRLPQTAAGTSTEG